MAEQKSLVIGQTRLRVFEICRRRFQLHYLRKLYWPAEPLPDKTQAAITYGQQFHRVLERHFLGLAVDEASLTSSLLRQWWLAFQNSGLKFPNGRFLPEHKLSLIVPSPNPAVPSFLLVGRFDLLVVGEDEENGPFVHVYDWKTSRPQSVSELQGLWQTRLYLALLAEGGGVLWPNGRSLKPEAITMTYWFTQEPDKPRIIRYSQTEHARNWADIQAVLSEIRTEFLEGEWPLTDDRTICRQCMFQVYCGRQTAETAVFPATEAMLEEETEDELWASLTDTELEPDIP
ncbi:MAG: PD-(D/E)XK nuclease family protein [Chloroflexi bacterium]|nr:MAG: PD-(D/E)XK nuclease family protein [Chloroflexota bacterium]